MPLSDVEDAANTRIRHGLACSEHGVRDCQHRRDCHTSPSSAVDVLGDLLLLL